MKRLYLLRHSKAGHTNKKILDDHERTLTDKGAEFCADIAKYLKKATPAPQQVLCSTAIRAKQTTELTLDALNADIPVKLISNLYLAEPNDILSVVHDADESLSSILVVGHNPGLQEFALLLSGSGDKKLFRAMRSNFPPPSLAVFDIPVEHWFEVEEQSGTLVDFFTTKRSAQKAA